MAPGEKTFAEIMSQPAIWQEALQVLADRLETLEAWWAEPSFEQVLLTGCGSTYYLSVVGAELLQAYAGIPARACPASELMLYPARHFDPQRRTLLLTVSRSGITRETVAAVRNFRRYGRGEAAAISCHSESELVAAVDWSLVVDAAREQSRVQTRSFSSMLLLMQALVGVRAETAQKATAALQTLPDRAARLLEETHDLARLLGEKPDTCQYLFLGSGALYGLACEMMLKLLEMSTLPSLAFQALEFLHGPRYAVNRGTRVVALLSEDILEEEIRALEEARRRGATVLALATGAADSDGPWDHRVTLPAADLPAWAQPILFLPMLQLLGWHEARSQGRDPDNLV